MSKEFEKFYKEIDKKKPSGWSAGYGTDINIDNVLTEAIVSEKNLKYAVWYLIQFMLAVQDFHDSGLEEDLRKAKIYGEQLLGRILK